MANSSGCKIDDVVDRYGLESPHDRFDSIHESLLALWKGKAGFEARGYRSVAEWFNKRLLRCAYRKRGRVLIGSRLDAEFATLTGDDDISRDELLDDLELDGIDGEDVVSDMASWSTVRRHLVHCLDGEKSRQTAETHWEKDSVEMATEQLVEKVEKALSSYETKGRIARATETDVTIQVQLSCPECPTRRSLSEALDRGHVCSEHANVDESAPDPGSVESVAGDVRTEK